MKRVFDFFTACLLLIVLFPLILILFVLVRMNLGSPAFFKQERPGLKGKTFYLYKFRTMLDQVNQQGELLPDELRLTVFGRFLRKFSLDELPQLFNVVKGELSLVGPRPLLIEYLPLYSKQQAKRHQIRPGITGWAQVNGRNTISWEEKFELDVWYVEHQSIMLDMKILWLTLIKVFRSEGINQEGHATTAKFKGERNIGD